MNRPKLITKHATFDSATPMQYHQTRLNEHNRHEQQLQPIADNQIDATKLPPIPTLAQPNAYQQNASTNHETQSKCRPPIPSKSTKFQHHLQQLPHLDPTTSTKNIDPNLVPMNVDDKPVDDKILVDNDDNVNDPCLIDQPYKLSKLTLSSSLQLINGSKFIKHKHQQSDSAITTIQNDPTNNQQNAHNDDDSMNSSIITESNTKQPNVKQHDELPKINPINETPHGTSNRRHHHSTSPNVDNCSNSKTAKTSNPQLKTVHGVVGNEACDLDSAVSALLFFHLIQRNADECNGNDNTTTLYLPILNVTRRALNTKTEVLWFLKHTLNIDKEYLTCKDDINWDDIKQNNIDILFTLVDHNYNPEFMQIGRVVEIIDHHAIESPEWILDNQKQVRLTLDTCVGSCTTLVAERLFYHYAEHHVPDDFLLLIYGTLLLDTTNFSQRIGRFTRRDFLLFRKINGLFKARRPNRDQLYRQLVDAKTSTADMGFFGLVSRDCKTFTDKNGVRVGIASIVGKMSARETVGLASNSDLDELFRTNKYDAFILMALVEDLNSSDGQSRDLVLISTNPKLFDELCDKLEQEKELLNLEQNFGPRSVSTDPEDIEVIAQASDRLEIASRSQQPSPQPEARDNSPRASPNQLEVPSEFSYKTRSWLQHVTISSRKVVAPIIQKVLYDGHWAAPRQE